MINDEVKANCNEVALVTVASRGIGREIALNLLEDGYVVVGTATTEEGARNIDTYESKSGKACVGIKLDVSQADEVSQSIAAISEKFVIPKVLINNAGVAWTGDLLSMPLDSWEWIVQMNLTSV